MSENIILPWQCRKETDRKFLKRDDCDEKRGLSYEDLKDQFYIDSDLCFKCKGLLAVNTTIKVEDRKAKCLSKTIIDVFHANGFTKQVRKRK